MVFQFQGCRSGSGLDLDSVGSVDPDSENGSRSGSRRAKMTHKSRKKLKYCGGSVRGNRVLDPDPHGSSLILIAGSGSGRTKMTHKYRK